MEILTFMSITGLIAWAVIITIVVAICALLTTVYIARLFRANKRWLGAKILLLPEEERERIRRAMLLSRPLSMLNCNEETMNKWLEEFKDEYDKLKEKDLTKQK